MNYLMTGAYLLRADTDVTGLGFSIYMYPKTLGAQVVMNYLKTGAYHAWSPFGRDITFQEPEGRPGCDFFGVNHYARFVLRFRVYGYRFQGSEGCPDCDLFGVNHYARCGTSNPQAPECSLCLNPDLVNPLALAALRSADPACCAVRFNIVLSMQSNQGLGIRTVLSLGAQGLGTSCH